MPLLKRVPHLIMDAVTLECHRKRPFYFLPDRDVRFGSKADVCSAKGHVRFIPESGRVRCTSPYRLSANTRRRV